MSEELMPEAWLYTDADGGRVSCVEQIEPPFVGWTEIPLYTAEQLARERIAAAEAMREACARVCDAVGNDLRNDWNANLGIEDELVEVAEDCSLDIRALDAKTVLEADHGRD